MVEYITSGGIAVSGSGFEAFISSDGRLSSLKTSDGTELVKPHCLMSLCLENRECQEIEVFGTSAPQISADTESLGEETYPFPSNVVTALPSKT